MDRVVILGGGVGGIIAARAISKHLSDRAEVTLLDKEGKHHFPPSYPWVVMGWREPNHTLRATSGLKARSVTHRTEEILSIDPAERRVTTKAGDLPYDHLLVATGAEYDPSAMEGFPEAAHHPYDLAGAVRLGKALRRFRSGTIAVGVSKMPFKCPAAPYETAFLMDYYLRRKGIRDRVDMSFFTPEGQPLPAAGPAIGKSVARLMKGRDISFHAKRETDRIDPEGHRIHFKEGEALDFDLLVAIPPHTTCKAVRDSPLTQDSPWIPVDRHTMRTAYDDVYAVGDVTTIPTPSANVPALPKAGVFAHGQAEVAAKNIVADMEGGEGARWDGVGACFMEIGYGKAGFVRGNFYGEGPPPIRMKGPSRWAHWGKVLFERRWLSKHFR
jgi:sulfide:quinone oxidoreductase